jgi:hypothetical protein
VDAFSVINLIKALSFLATGLAFPFVVFMVAALVATLERLDFVLAGASIFAPVFSSTQRHTAARELATLHTVYTDGCSAFVTTAFGYTTVTQDVTVVHSSKAAAFTPEPIEVHHDATFGTLIPSHALEGAQQQCISVTKSRSFATMHNAELKRHKAGRDNIMKRGKTSIRRPSKDEALAWRVAFNSLKYYVSFLTLPE